MRKIKNKSHAIDSRLTKKLLEAVDKNDSGEIIRIGKLIVKDGSAPEPIYVALAYGYSLAKEKSEKQKALKWIERARPDSLGKNYIPLYFNVYIDALNEWGRITDAYEVAKKEVEYYRNLPENEQPNQQYMSELLGKYANAALQIGKYIDAFEAYREAWEMRAPGDLYGRANYLSALLFTSQYLTFSSEDIYEMHHLYSDVFANIKKYEHDMDAVRARVNDPSRKIRIGYISPDFRQHVAFFFFFGLVAFYDTSRFEVHCYSLSSIADAYTEQIKSYVDDFVDVHKTNYHEIAAKIYADEIDILVELAGHTAHNGLPVLAYKPAPVQISGIGYLTTTGLDTVDYFITDKIVDPPNEGREKYFSEKLLYLPSHFSYAPREELAVPEGARCKDRGYVLFGVFNQYRKVTDDMLAAWLEIINRVPDSKILLKSKAMRDEKILAEAKERLKNIGFDLERVIFEPDSADYMDRYLDIDIALDTYPYTGGGTTFDALYMGVPVITLYGERRNTRFSLGILTNIGLSQLAFDNIKDYIDMAVTLAADVELLDKLHREIRPMMQKSAAVTPQGYAKNMEQKYREIFGLNVTRMVLT